MQNSASRAVSTYVSYTLSGILTLGGGKVKRYIVALWIALCIACVGCSEIARGAPRGPQATDAQTVVVGPAEFRSPQGFAFDVPKGWKAWLTESRVYIAVENWSGGYTDFVIQTCPRTEVESCLGDPQMPARLVKIEDTVLVGRPVREYTFWRRNKEKEWTLEWAEVHTLLITNGKTFDVVARIPPYAPSGRWVVYDQIRRSFRLTDS